MGEKKPNEILSNIWNSKNAVVQNQFYHAKYLILLPHNFIISVLYLKKMWHINFIAFSFQWWEMAHVHCTCKCREMIFYCGGQEVSRS